MGGHDSTKQIRDVLNNQIQNRSVGFFHSCKMDEN